MAASDFVKRHFEEPWSDGGPAIKTATPAQAAPVISIVVRAFSADPAALWAFGDGARYAMHFPGFVRAFAGNAFAHGSAYYAGGYAGAALWLPPGVYPDDDALMPLLEHSVRDAVKKDCFELFEQMARFHPHEPHWYLPMMGVDLPYQGTGYGSALLRHTLERCDNDNRCAYLESTNARNIPLYHRHGFVLLGTLQVGTSPPVFPMLRQPGMGGGSG